MHRVFAEHRNVKLTQQYSDFSVERVIFRNKETSEQNNVVHIRFWISNILCSSVEIKKEI